MFLAVTYQLKQDPANGCFRNGNIEQITCFICNTEYMEGKTLCKYGVYWMWGGGGGGGHSGTVVTHFSPTSEVGGSNPEPYVGKIMVSCR